MGPYPLPLGFSRLSLVQLLHCFCESVGALVDLGDV